MRRTIYKFLFSLIFLMGVTSAWADDLTLFTTNFSTADGWTTESIITSSTTEATRTIKGTAISFKGFKSKELTVAVGATAAADGTLTFTDNNLLASAGEASKANFYMAIPVSGVNGEVTVTTTGDATKWYYSYDDGSTGNIVDRAQASANGGFTITGLTKSNVTIYIGSNAKRLNSITITTPKAIKSQAVTGVKIGGTKVEGASFDANNTFVSAQGAPAAPKASIIKHIVYADDSEEDVDVDVTLAKNGEFFVGSATINEVVYTIKVPVTASNACQLTSILFSNSVYGAIAEPKAESGTPGEEGYVAAANGKVTVCYMAGTDAPTITESSIKVSEAAQYNVNGNTITVTAEDETTTALYDIVFNAITPLAVNSDIEKTTFTEVPSWVSNPYEWSDSKGVKFAKAVDEANNMRIAKGFTRQYYFVGPAKSLTLTSMDAARAINVYVNGTKVDGITTTEKKGDITITLSETENNMVCIESNQTGGDGGFTDYAVVAAEKAPEPSNWKDIKLDFTTENSFIRTVTTEQWGVVNTGVALDPTNSPIAVSTESEESRMTITGKYHGTQYGLASAPKFVVPVEGPVKISIGSSYYEGSYTLTNAEGTVSKTFSSLVPGKLWSQKDPQVVIAYYDGDATTLTIAGSGNSYCPYFAIEAVDPAEIPNDRTIKFNAGEGTGKAPSAATIENGSEFVVPTNTTLYKEGYTLTAWTDGTENYATGATIKVVDDMELTAVYTKNEADINNRNEDVTVKWEFATKKGVTLVSYNGSKGFLVGQANVNGKTIDVKLDIDATAGKFDNSNGDWAQVNSITKFILPSAKDAVISTFAMNDPTAESTANGQSYDSFANNVATWTMQGEETTAEVTIKAGSWYQWIQVVLPKTEAAGPTSEWRDIKLDFTTEESFIREVTTTQWGVVNTGVAIDEEGTPSAVGVDANDSRITIAGKYHGTQYGLASAPKFVVPVDGPVKISIGSSYYEGTYTITDGNGVEVTSFSSLIPGKLWSRTNPDVVTYIYTGEATTLTITGAGNSYCPYLAVEKYEIPEPKEWRDIKLDFTTEESFIREVTTTQWGVINTGVAIDEEGTPSAVGVDTNDSRMTIVGKYHGTQYGLAAAPKFVVPVEGPVKISIGSSYYEGTYTITDGNGVEVTSFSSLIPGKLWSRSNPDVVTYEYKGKATTLTITGAGNSYCPYFAVEAIEAPAPTKKEKVIYSTEFSDWAAAAVADSYTSDVTTTDKQEITFTLHQTKVDPTSFDTSRFKEPSTPGYLIAEKNKQGTITTTAFNNITTLTFVHGATGGSRGWGLKVKGDGDSDWVTVSDAFADPSQGQKVEVEINRSNVQLQFYNLADAQNAYLMSLEIKGMVEVTGESYTVGIAAAPAEGGAVTIYPKADDYTEGDEISLTATENFGYDFVNWTNAAGEEVSTDAKFNTTVTANETFTANFVKVDTYAINVAVEGGANDYMVTFDPEPTIVNGKNMYEAGAKVTVAAIENPIITFNNWSTGETSKAIEVTVDKDIDLTATFSATDYIVGWDFVKAGNNGRKADFYAADNDAVSLVMYKADGSTSGWLDKSLGTGGYEGRPGGVCWVVGTENGDVGNCYWQTKVNAEAFTDLKIQTAMVYNYNAYQKYDVQASLNGTDWETIGSINMPAVKSWTDLKADFPATYNNQKEVYVRWIADKTSKVDGAASKNDGACIGATYITGTPQLVDDGTAPALVSSVPANGANNASANGKIVLTFDEKVKVADGATATLGDAQLTPSVSGKTVTFEYKGLQYSTAYTFSLPANSIADLTDNYLTEAITINFQTKDKPTINKGTYDVIVTNGEEMKAAIAQANSRADKTKRFRIFVMPGTHKIPVYDTQVTVTVELKGGAKEQRTYDEPRTYITADNISIIGADYETTTITNTTPTETFNGQFGEANISEGIGNNDVFQISGKNTYFQGVTVKTGIGDARGRDIAIQDKGDKTIFKETRLWGYQDTYTNNNSNGRFYFEGGVVRGRTDYLCGKGDIWFEGVTLQQCGQGGYPIVPSQPKNYGWIFNGCTLTPETSDVTCTLGRPWGSGTPIALLINTTMEVVPGAEGWSEMSGGWPKRFAEYNSVTKTGTVIDLSQRKTTFGGKENCNNPVLTAEEAAEYSIAKVLSEDDNWDPTAYTEQASAPTNVSLKDEALTWDDSNYVFCWAVIKNGDIVEFTTTPSYTVDDKTATWSVRAANEMGGLGEATIADTTSGINEAVSAQSRSAKYVTPTGIVIVKDGKKYTVTGAQMK